MCICICYAPIICKYIVLNSPQLPSPTPPATPRSEHETSQRQQDTPQPEPGHMDFSARACELVRWPSALYLCVLVLLLPMVQECSAACYELLCMQKEAPCLAESLRGSYGVSCNTRAVDAPDISSGWQQSKLIWALSAEVGQASRIPCDILWHV